MCHLMPSGYFFVSSFKMFLFFCHYFFCITLVEAHARRLSLSGTSWFTVATEHVSTQTGKRLRHAHRLDHVSIYSLIPIFHKSSHLYTLSKDQKIRVILRRSEYTFDLLQWLSMRKQISKHAKIKKTFVPKIILHNYILYKGDPTYVAIFPVD